MYEGAPHLPAPWQDERFRWAVPHYACWDEGHQKRVPFESTGTSWAPDFSPAALDGDTARWVATRLRRLC